MKTGLTKKQKTTSIFFTDADDMIEVCTHNTPLKNRLAQFLQLYTGFSGHRPNCGFYCGAD